MLAVVQPSPVAGGHRTMRPVPQIGDSDQPAIVFRYVAPVYNNMKVSWRSSILIFVGSFRKGVVLAASSKKAFSVHSKAIRICILSSYSFSYLLLYIVFSSRCADLNISSAKISTVYLKPMASLYYTRTRSPTLFKMTKDLFTLNKVTELFIESALLNLYTAK